MDLNFDRVLSSPTELDEEVQNCVRQMNSDVQDLRIRASIKIVRVLEQEGITKKIDTRNLNE